MRQLLPDPVDGPDLDVVYALPVDVAAPHVRVNFIASADGAAAVDGTSGGLQGPGDKAVFSTLRGLCDAVLVGAGTVRAEGYGQARPSDERRRRRMEAGLAGAPTIAVVSGRLDLDPATRLFVDAGPRPVVLTAASAPADRRGALAGVADVIDCGDEHLDVARALEVLGDRGLLRVLCEGGPHLFGDLIAADLVDELCLSLAPALAAGDGTRISAGPTPAQLRGLRLASLCEEASMLFARYARTGTPPAAAAS